VTSSDEERDTLADLARGDIPARFCRVVEVEIYGDAAHVWLVTNTFPHFERYQVDFARVNGAWVDAGGSGGFQTGTPERVMRLAGRIERGEV
jgi:hypothetical protein